MGLPFTSDQFFGVFAELRQKTRYLMASALAVAVDAPVVLLAQKPVPTPTGFKTEKCYGIAKGRQERGNECDRARARGRRSRQVHRLCT